MEAKMGIMFIGKKSRITRHQLLPIYLRVTIEKRRFEVATHQHVKPSEWSAVAGRIKGKSETAIDINMALDIIKKKGNELQQQPTIDTIPPLAKTSFF